jgi:hypothetical protein
MAETDAGAPRPSLALTSGHGGIVWTPMVPMLPLNPDYRVRLRRIGRLSFQLSLLLALVVAPSLPNLPPLMAPVSPQAAAAPAPLPLSGRVEQVAGDLMPGPGGRSTPRPAPGRRVMAVRGTLPAGGRPLWSGPLPPQRLLAEATTDADGHFQLLLPPGVVTLLIAVPGGYWLNRFDGRGDYSSVLLEHGLGPVLLLDDRGTLH